MGGSQVNWRKVNKSVKNLRQRIFLARKVGNFRKLRSLQKLLQKSYANLLLSVRRITQTNKGRATAGIDKEIGFFSIYYAKLTIKLPSKQTSNSKVFKVSKSVSRTFNQLELIVDAFNHTTRSLIIKVSNNLI
jgi:retron-type reverse transcriptase